jgi:hypothetical protein
MKDFGSYFTSVYLNYRNSKLRVDVNGDCRDLFAHLNREESTIDEKDDIPEVFEHWKIRGKHQFLPFEYEELGGILQEQLKQEFKRRGLEWVSHPKVLI